MRRKHDEVRLLKREDRQDGRERKREKWRKLGGKEEEVGKKSGKRN